MAIPLIVAGAIAAAGAAGGAISRSRKNKKIKKLIDKMPKYKIQDEAYENQNIARSEAYGRDRAIQMQESELEQDAANAVADAKDVTSGTSGLLSTIAAIQANKDQTRRNLGTAEAQLQAAKKAQLLGINQQMIDEKDKQFYQNQVAPWDARRRQLEAKKQEANSFWGSLFSSGMSMLGGSSMGGKFGGGGGGGGQGSAPTMDQSMYSSNSRYS